MHQQMALLQASASAFAAECYLPPASIATLLFTALLPANTYVYLEQISVAGCAPLCFLVVLLLTCLSFNPPATWPSRHVLHTAVCTAGIMLFCLVVLACY